MGFGFEFWWVFGGGVGCVLMCNLCFRDLCRVDIIYGVGRVVVGAAGFGRGGCGVRAAFGVFLGSIGGGYTRLVTCGFEILGVWYGLRVGLCKFAGLGDMVGFRGLVLGVLGA